MHRAAASAEGVRRELGVCRGWQQPRAAHAAIRGVDVCALIQVAIHLGCIAIHCGYAHGVVETRHGPPHPESSRETVSRAQPWSGHEGSITIDQDAR